MDRPVGVHQSSKDLKLRSLLLIMPVGTNLLHVIFEDFALHPSHLFTFLGFVGQRVEACLKPVHTNRMAPDELRKDLGARVEDRLVDQLGRVTIFLPWLPPHIPRELMPL